MSVKTLMPTLLKLSVAERRKIIDQLWDSLPESVDPSEVPDWHIEILKERLAEAEKNPGEGIPLKQFLKELRKSP